MNQFAPIVIVLWVLALLLAIIGYAGLALVVFAISLLLVAFPLARRG